MQIKANYLYGLFHNYWFSCFSQQICLDITIGNTKMYMTESILVELFFNRL